MTDCILAADIGTTSLKVGLISMKGDLVSLATARNLQKDARFLEQIGCKLCVLHLTN